MEKEDQKQAITELPEGLKKLGATIKEDGTIDLSVVFKFKNSFAKSLLDYLYEKPMAEVENIVPSIEKCTEETDSYIEYNGLLKIVHYLKTNCTYKEAKPFIDEMTKDIGGIITFTINKNKEEENEEK